MESHAVGALLRNLQPIDLVVQDKARILVGRDPLGPLQGRRLILKRDAEVKLKDFPALTGIRQRFKSDRLTNLSGELRKQFDASGVSVGQGERIAIAVRSITPRRCSRARPRAIGA